MMEAVIFIGLQAAGKSSFYKENFFKTHVRINLDMLKTRRRENILLKACLVAKQPFVVDNTNPAKIDRKKYIQLSKDAGFKVVGYYLKSNIDASVIRNAKRTGKERIPVVGIKRTFGKLQLPNWNEGFDNLYYVKLDEDNGFIVEEWKDLTEV